MKIVIIEDDSVTAKVYSTVLAREGFEVEVAHDGREGVQAVAEQNPDVILLDLMLPYVNGIDLIKQIKKYTDYKGLIYAYTNAYTAKMVSDAYAAGAKEVFNKALFTPTKFAELLAPAPSH